MYLIVNKYLVLNISPDIKVCTGCMWYLFNLSVGIGEILQLVDKYF